MQYLFCFSSKNTENRSLKGISIHLSEPSKSDPPMQQQPKITYRVCSSDGAAAVDISDPNNIYAEVHHLGINIDVLEKNTSQKLSKPKIPDILTCIDLNDNNTWIHIKNIRTIGNILKRTGHNIQWRQEIPCNIVNVYCVYGLVFLSLSDETVLILNEENGTPAFPTVCVSGCVRVFQQVGYDGIIILSNYGRMLVWNFGKDSESDTPIITTTFDQQYPLYFGKTIKVKVEDTYELKTMQLTVIIDDGLNKLWYSYERQAWVAYEFNSDFFDVKIEPETLKALEDEFRKKQIYHDETLIDSISKITKAYLDTNLHDKILALYSQICQMGMVINIFCNKQFIDYIEVMNNILMDQCPELIEIVMASREYQAFTGIHSEGAVSIKAAILAQHPPLVVSKIKHAEVRTEHKATIQDAINELKNAVLSSASGENILKIVDKLEENIGSGTIQISDKEAEKLTPASDTDAAPEAKSCSEDEDSQSGEIPSTNEPCPEQTESDSSDRSRKILELEVEDVPCIDDEYSDYSDGEPSIRRAPRGGKAPRKMPPSALPADTPKVAQMRPKHSTPVGESSPASLPGSGNSDLGPPLSPPAASKRPSTGGKAASKRPVQPVPVQRTGPVFPQQGMQVAPGSVKMSFVGSSFYQIKKTTPDDPIVVGSSSSNDEEPIRSTPAKENTFPNGFKAIQSLSTSDADKAHLPVRRAEGVSFAMINDLRNYPQSVVDLYHQIQQMKPLQNKFALFEANSGAIPPRFERFFIIDPAGHELPRRYADFKPITDLVGQLLSAQHQEIFDVARSICDLLSLIRSFTILCLERNLYSDVIYLNRITDKLYHMYLQCNKSVAKTAITMKRPDLGNRFPPLPLTIRVGFKNPQQSGAAVAQAPVPPKQPQTWASRSEPPAAFCPAQRAPVTWVASSIPPQAASKRPPQTLQNQPQQRSAQIRPKAANGSSAPNMFLNMPKEQTPAEDSQASVDSAGANETTEDSQLVTDNSEEDSQVDSQVSEDDSAKSSISNESQSDFKSFHVNESDWI